MSELFDEKTASNIESNNGLATVGTGGVKIRNAGANIISSANKVAGCGVSKDSEGFAAETDDIEEGTHFSQT